MAEVYCVREVARGGGSGVSSHGYGMGLLDPIHTLQSNPIQEQLLWMKWI